MGGIRTDEKGEVKNLKGLFSAGESACWDLHGFNRLGGNSVAEAVVAGMIVGDYMSDFASKSDIDISTSVIEKKLNEQINYIQSLITNNGKNDIFKIKEEMQILMDEKVGIFRTGEHLQEAVTRLEELYKLSLDVSIDSKKSTMNPILEEAYRVPKMLKLALCVAQGALERKESRGAHSREDYPKRDDINWLKRTISTWGKNDTKATLSYEILDISTMEIPPAYRGYGSKDKMILSQEATKRQEEIDKIKEKNPKANRHEIQDLIMPYKLQDEYKVKNQRANIGDE
jgi:fumarate reductase flavoprotein subunit